MSVSRIDTIPRAPLLPPLPPSFSLDNIDGIAIKAYPRYGEKLPG